MVRTSRIRVSIVFTRGWSRGSGGGTGGVDTDDTGLRAAVAWWQAQAGGVVLESRQAPGSTLLVPRWWSLASRSRVWHYRVDRYSSVGESAGQVDVIGMDR
jgi:hypothetical protein